MKTMSIRIPESLSREIHFASAQRGKSQNEWIREVLEAASRTARDEWFRKECWERGIDPDGPDPCADVEPII